MHTYQLRFALNFILVPPGRRQNLPLHLRKLVPGTSSLIGQAPPTRVARRASFDIQQSTAAVVWGLVYSVSHSPASLVTRIFTTPCTPLALLVGITSPLRPEPTILLNSDHDGERLTPQLVGRRSGWPQPSETRPMRAKTGKQRWRGR